MQTDVPGPTGRAGTCLLPYTFTCALTRFATTTDTTAAAGSAGRIVTLCCQYAVALFVLVAGAPAGRVVVRPIAVSIVVILAPLC